MIDPLRIGVIGCGAISGAYLAAAKKFPILRILAVADINGAAAEAKANEFNVSRVCSVCELLADPSVELVLNLTVPGAHASIALDAIAAGKHTYSEKPLGVSRDEGRKILRAATEKGVRVGCAPDTFLGAGMQTARKIIDDGVIGRPVAFTAFMMNRGHETWHPNPDFYYQPGGGPMFDMGPYYLTALLFLLGPIRRIQGMASIAVPRRTITSQPRAGTAITVRTPDHVVGNVEFVGGAVGTLIQSFATWHPAVDEKQPIEIFGTDGAMRAPDPNRFDLPVSIRLAHDPAWQEAPHAFVQGYDRSVGLADMAYAIRSGRKHRCNGELAFAALDAMQGFFDSSAGGHDYRPAAPFERPAPMPAHLPFGTLDS
ncbi:MAG TPA: Gfo/Idh/MocA family oxidoreductase [Tepidisphaeraceae bacterium]|jgi:predicted dehydrogenase|nr:Gfo/Idh/MocA family oxidoreductase [Tepidisphaeraceae bacterium]